MRREVMQGGLAVPGFDWDAPLDGVLRRDKVRNEPSPPLEELQFHEWTLAPGEPVVLMGRCSAARGGLVHDDRTGRPLRVLEGDTDSVRSQLHRQVIALQHFPTLDRFADDAGQDALHCTS